MIKGKAVVQAQKISRQDILTALGDPPGESAHCAPSAANTIDEAVRDYIALPKDPWKR